MALDDFDYNAAIAAGYSDDDILDGLQRKGRLDFDLGAARKAGYSSSEILSSILPQRAPAAPPPEPSSLLRRAGDLGLSAIKGAIAIPETAIGLADLVTGGAAGRGAEAIGIRTKEAKEQLDYYMSPEQQAASRRVSEAKGFLPTAGAMLSNPSTILQTAVESAPSMLAGGGIARGATALAPRLGAVAAGALGEGVVGAGQAAEQIRQQQPEGDLSLSQVGSAVASGVGTGIFGMVGGRLAQRLGIADIDTALAQAGSMVGGTKGVARRIVEGGIAEGVFEELPQSIQEQIWQNVAMDRPLMEGVPKNAAQGLIAGGLFGGVAGGALQGRPPAPGEPAQEGVAGLLPYKPDPFISFPDGSVGRQSDADAFINGLPEDQRLAARARLYGMAEQPLNPEDILQAQSVDQAIAIADRAIEEGTPEFRAQRDADIDAAWNQYLGERAGVRMQEFEAALAQRSAAEDQVMQEQLADQAVERANILTEAQGFGASEPTAMQLAMQRAQEQQVQRAAAPAESAAQPAAAADVARAREILTAAGVTGNERMAALRSIRTGENTLEDLADAHPPKAINVANRPQAALPGAQLGIPGAEVPAPVQQVSAPARAPGEEAIAAAGLPSAERLGVPVPPAATGAGTAGRPVAELNGISGVAGERLPGAKESLQATLRNYPDIQREDGSYKEPEWTELPNGFAYRQYVVGGEPIQEIRAPKKGKIEPSVLRRGLQRNGKPFGEREATGTLGDVFSGAAFADFDKYFNAKPQLESNAPAAPTQGDRNAPQEISQQAGVQAQRGEGDRVGQTAEAGRGDRVQRATRGEEGQAARTAVAAQEVAPSVRPGREEEMARLRAARDERIAAQRAKPKTEAEQETERKYARQEAEIASAKEAAEARRARGEFANPQDEALYQQAVDFVKRTGNWKRPAIQNELKIAFERATKYVDRMEREGIVSPAKSNGERTVLSQEKPLKSEAPASGGMTAADVTKATASLRAKWMGFNRIEIVQSVDDLPADLQERSKADQNTEGLYDPRTNRVYLIADNLATPERAVLVAAHEVVGHGGLRALQDKTVNEALKYASGNRFVKELAVAINDDRDGKLSAPQAIDEAIAELSAAIETGDYAGIEERYNVKIPQASRDGVRATIARVIEAISRFIAGVTKQPVDKVSNADIRYLIGQQQAAVEGRVGTAPAASSEPAMASEKVAEEPAMQSRAPKQPAKPAEVVPKWAENLTPEQKAALRKSGAIYEEKTMRQKVDELRDGALKKLQYGILDQFAPIKDQLGKIPYVLARMAKNADGTLEALMLYGRPHLDAEGGMLVDTTKKGFIETMQALNGEHDRFFSWLAGRRAEQLKKEGRENLFTDEDISALATLNQGKMKDGSSREAAYLRAQKDVAELNKSVLDIAQESGLIDGESRKVWASDFYVPFYRVMEEGVTGPSIKSGLVNQKSIKKLKGGTNNLGDLTQNMLMNWSTLLTASAKNRAAKAALDAAVDIGAATEAPEATIRAMAKSAATKAVSYMENGVNRWHVVEDEHLLAAISALEFNGYNNQAMKAMTWFKNTLTKAITSLPGFKVRNLIRDSLSSIAVSNASYNPLANLKNGYSLLRDKDEMAQMVAGGGIFRFGSYMEGNRGEHVKKLIDSGVPADTILDTKAKMQKFLTRIWDGYQKVGDLSENLNRAALYKKRRAEGVSHLEASFEARDLMDFGLSGAWAGVRALNQVLPFFNARLQGMYKLGRGYNDDPKRMGAVIGAVALASVALMLAYKDDDDFKKRTDADRNNYWWFKVGDTAYRIPKPFEVGAAGSAIEHLTALLVDENTDAKRFGSQIGELVNGQLALNPIPQVFRPMIDIYANKDAFTGRPIESLAMQRLRPEDRYTYNTSELARLLSKSGVFVDPISLVSGTGVKQLSPVQIDSMIRGYFSGVGTMATAAVDGLLHHSVIDRGEALPMTLKQMTSNFASELPENSSRYVDMLYRTAQDIEQTYASYRNAIKNGDIEKARELQRDEGEKIAKYHLVESLKKNEAKIGQQIQRVINSKDLTGEQKEEMVRRLRRQQDLIARQFATRQ